MKNFIQYLLSEAKYSKMSPAEFTKQGGKYHWRIEVFLDMYKNKKPFTLTDGSNVKFNVNLEVIKAMESKDAAKIRAIELEDEKGNTYKLSSLGKTDKFGGKGAGASTAKEDRELTRLRDFIEREKAEIPASTVPVVIDGKKYEIAGAETTKGTPKSDFHLIDIDGKPVVWLSHKDGSKPQHFQQWAGVSRKAGKEISDHREVKAFVADLKKLYPDGIPRATTVARKIRDDALKKRAVYGYEYGKKYSENNVNATLQGTVKFDINGKKYEVKAPHVLDNGAPIRGGYEPVLMAMYKGDRSDAGVKGARITISPIKSRKINDFI